MALINGFRPVNIAKFLRTGFFIEHLQKQSFADIPQNRVTPLFLKVSQTSQESSCIGVSFKKTCRLKACNFIKKDSHTGAFL